MIHTCYSETHLIKSGFTVWDVHWKGHAFGLNTVKCSLAGLLFVIVSLIFSAVQSENDVATSAPTTITTNGTSSTDALDYSVEFSAGMLVVSGIFGIVLGDSLWLLALSKIGARRVILVDSVKPFLSALLAWPLLNEPVRPLMWLGMFITVSAVIVVSLERETTPDGETSRVPNLSMLPGQHEVNSGEHHQPHGYIESSDGHVAFPNPVPIMKTAEADSSNLVFGYILATANVLLDVGGALITKEFGNTFNTFEIGGIRFGSSAIMLWVAALMYRALRRPVWPEPLNSVKDSVQSDNLPSDIAVENGRVGGTIESTAVGEHETTESTVEITLSTFINESSIVGDSLAESLDNSTNSTPKFSSSAESTSTELLKLQNNLAVTRICKHPDGCENNSVEVSGLCKKHLKDRISLNVPWWKVLPPMAQRSWVLVVIGVFVTTFLCPSLQNYAIFELPIATYSTLVSLTPIWSLPVVYVLKGERVSVRAVLGSVAAVVGIVPLYV